MGTFPTVRRVLERCVADVARHECTNEKPALGIGADCLVVRKRVECSWSKALVHSNDEQRSRAGAHWLQRKAAAFTEWHKRRIRRFCDGLGTPLLGHHSCQRSGLDHASQTPALQRGLSVVVLSRAGRRQTRGSLAWKLIKQYPRISQLRIVEPLSDPAVDRLEELQCGLPSAQLPQLCQSGCRAKLPEFELLISRNSANLLKREHRLVFVALGGCVGQ
jgi:hypothetical protein